MIFELRMKLCQSHVNRNEFDEALTLLGQLHKSCQTPDGQDDRKTKGSELLEIYALELRINGARGDSVRMKELFEKTKDLTSAVTDPRVQSVIKECWGVMYGDEGSWSKAKVQFYDAFRFYDEIGQAIKAKQCLKYVVVANMLSGSNTNPFDSRDAQAYAKEKDIEVIQLLNKAYDTRNVPDFNKALDEINKQGDKFLRMPLVFFKNSVLAAAVSVLRSLFSSLLSFRAFLFSLLSLHFLMSVFPLFSSFLTALSERHLESMIADFQARAIVTMIKSYRRIKLESLARVLRITTERVEEILIPLILDNQVVGKIDQVKGVLDLTSSSGGSGKKFTAIENWSSSLTGLVTNLNQPSA
jgi:COP9 signalosome complex subunit 2